MTFRPTKERLVAGLAILAAGLTIQGRLGKPVSYGPLPQPPAVEAPADIPKDEIPVLRPRLIPKARATDGRDPFATSDIWEDPRPAALPLPPELAEERVVPVLSIGGGRARAPRAPRIVGLPKVVKEDKP